MKNLICHSQYSRIDFLDSGSYIMDGITSLHDHILFYEIIILVVVTQVLIAILYFKNNFPLKDISHGYILEIVQTFIPGIILILIALPSFRLLYLMDDLLDTSMSIKVIGNQQYQTYAYGDEQFDSYMLQDLNLGDVRNLDTDSHLIIPSNLSIRFLVTSTDVIHSQAIPALGIKMDALPGRINQIATEIYRPGIYYGQCYELCGVGHAFMPITLKVI